MTGTIVSSEWKESGRSLILEFPITTPGLNSMLGTHPMKSRALKAKVRELMLEACWGKPQFKKARIYYTRYGKAMDQANLAGSSKVWIDRLVNYGIIPDDNPDFVQEVYQYAIGKPKTVIEIRECV